MASSGESVRRSCAVRVRERIRAHAPELDAALERAFARDVTAFGWSFSSVLDELRIRARSWPGKSHVPSPIALVMGTRYASDLPEGRALAELLARGGTIVVETDSIPFVAGAAGGAVSPVIAPAPGLHALEVPAAPWLGDDLAVRVKQSDVLALVAREDEEAPDEVLARVRETGTPIVARTRIGRGTVVSFAVPMTGDAEDASAIYGSLALLAWTIAGALTPPGATR